MEGEGAAREGRPLASSDAGAAPSGWDLIASCIADHHAGDADAAVTVLSDVEDDRRLPASHFFRSEEDLPPLEQSALKQVRGRVLDVGAGAGAHALHLQARNVEVTALEVAAAAVSVMNERGVLDARVGDVFTPAADERWDTVLILMNGTTLAGSEAELTALLASAAERLSDGGRILIDSTDLREEGGGDVGDDGRYVGEVHLQVEYRGHRSAPFPVLYADPDAMSRAADRAGLVSRVIESGEDGAYLAEVTRR